MLREASLNQLLLAFRHLDAQFTTAFARTPVSCFNAVMDEPTSEQIQRLETSIAHLERQYEQLNEVVVEQGRLLSRLQKEFGKTSDAVLQMELERVRANNQKPPHY